MRFPSHLRDRAVSPVRVRAFTLIEVLVTVAVLIIVMGLMVSLARYVRRQAADQLTKDLLVRLEVLTARYAERHGGELPPVTPLVPEAAGGPADHAVEIELDADDGLAPSPATASVPDEAMLQQNAAANSRDFVRALGTLTPPGDSRGLFGLASGTEPLALRDAWGREIVFMPRGHPLIGTALGDKPFFFSAGPDGRYLTQEDNLYSYEMR